MKYRNALILTVLVNGLALGTTQIDPKIEVAERVESIALSPDGRTIAIGSFDGSLTLWDSASFQLKASKTFTLGIYSVVFSSNDLVFAAPNANPTQNTFDGNSLNEVAKFQLGPSEDSSALAVSADHKYLVSGGLRNLSLWDLKSKRIVASTPPGTQTWYSRVAFQRDGKAVIASSGHSSVGNKLYYLEPVNGSLFHRGEYELPYAGFEGHFAMFPHSDHLAALKYGEGALSVDVFETKTRRKVKTFTWPNDQAWPGSFCLSPTGQYAALFGRLSGAVIDLISGQTLLEFPLIGESGSRPAIFSLDESELFVSTNNAIYSVPLEWKIKKVLGSRNLQDAKVEELWQHLASTDARLAYLAQQELAHRGAPSAAYLRSELKAANLESYLTGFQPSLENVQEVRGFHALAKTAK